MKTLYMGIFRQTIQILLFFQLFLSGGTSPLFAQSLLPRKTTSQTIRSSTHTAPILQTKKIKEAHVKNEIVVKIKKEYLTFCGNENIDIESFKSAVKLFPLKSIRAKYPQENKRFFPNKTNLLANNPLEGIYSIQFSKDVDIEKVIGLLSELPQIEYADHIKVYTALFQPNDPLADSLLADSVMTGKISYLSGRINQYYLASIKAYQAWGITKGDTNVLIGVVDVSYDTANVELRGNIKLNKLDPIDGIDNDGNGYLDDYWGWNTANSNGTIHVPQDGNTVHGTRVAGVIGAKANNGIGITGIGYNCKIVPVRCWNGFGLQSTYDGIYYCVKRGCKVINCSWGGAGAPQQSEQDIINYATANGAVIIAAAGNGAGGFYQEADFYPASYKNVVSVAQCLPDGRSFLAGPVNAVTYSKYVDLIAPGIAIYSLAYSGYEETTGSSLSSPIVAGAAGLVCARFPNFTPQQIMEQLRVSADYKDSLPDNQSMKEKMGYGMLNVFRAVSDTTLKAARWDSDSIQNTFLGTSGFAFEGDTMRLSARMVNYLKSTSNLQVKISTTSANLIVLDSIVSFGTITTLGTKWNSSTPFRVYIKPGSPKSFSALFRVGFSDGSYRDYQYITIHGINPPKVYTTRLDMNINPITITVANNGRLAFDDADANVAPSVGSGYKYLGGYHRAWEMGFLAATSTANVSDCIRSAQNGFGQQLKDTDFKTETPVSYSNGPGNQHITVRYSDSTAVNPIGLYITQKTYAWKDAPNDKYVIVEYTIQNSSGLPIDSLCTGIFTDWYVYGAFRYRGQWDASIQTGVTAAASGIPYLNGIQVLYPTQKPAHFIFDYNVPAAGVNIVDGLSETEKFGFMSKGILNQSAGLTGSGIYLASYVGTTLYDLLPGTKRTVAFAVMNGVNYSDLKNAAIRAKSQFQGFKGGPKPSMDSLFTVCKGNSQLLRPIGNSLYNFYDTIPGIRPAVATKVSAYTTTGIFTPKTYYITNADSVIEGLPKQVLIRVDSVRASFGYSLSTQTPRTIILTSSSSGISWKWNLGDGATATGSNLSHTYTVSGTFPVQLEVIVTSGCRDTALLLVNIPVYVPSPKPIIDSQQVVCKGQPKELRPSGGTLFNFYDTIPGTSFALAIKVPAYTTTGINSLQTFYISNADSIFEGLAQKVTVDFSRIKASFDYSVSQVNPLTVDFISTTPGNVFAWQLGDGNTASGANLTHTYPSSGTFPVRLQSVDMVGCSDTLQVPVLIPLVTEVTTGLASDLIIHPNPAHDLLQIRAVGLTGNSAEIRLINAMGQVMYAEKILFQSNSFVHIPVENMAIGVYTLMVQYGQSAIARKISIVR